MSQPRAPYGALLSAHGFGERGRGGLVLRLVRCLGGVGRHQARPDALEGPSNVFLSGDSGAAKQLTTGRLLTGLGWPPSAQLDIGGISTARGQEHFAPLFMGIAGGLGTVAFNINVVTLPAEP